jgi:hypothetical protein
MAGSGAWCRCSSARQGTDVGDIGGVGAELKEFVVLCGETE